MCCCFSTGVGWVVMGWLSVRMFLLLLFAYIGARVATILYIKFVCLFADVSKLHIIHEGQPNLIPFSLSEAQLRSTVYIHIFV